MTRTIDIVFDGPPGPTAGRFVEVEDESGASINFGEWIERGDGFWALRIPDTADALEQAQEFSNHLEYLNSELQSRLDQSLLHHKQLEAVVNPLRQMIASDELMFDWKDSVEECGWHQEWTEMCDALRLTAGESGNG